MEFQYADGQLLPFGFMCCPNNDQGLQLCPTVYRMCIRRMSKQLHNRALNLPLNQMFLCCENGNDLRQLAKGQSYWLLAITADLYCYRDSLANQRASAQYLHIRNPICIVSGTCVVCPKCPLMLDSVKSTQPLILRDQPSYNLEKCFLVSHYFIESGVIWTEKF